MVGISKDSLVKPSVNPCRAFLNFGVNLDFPPYPQKQFYSFTKLKLKPKTVGLRISDFPGFKVSDITKKLTELKLNL